MSNAAFRMYFDREAVQSMLQLVSRYPAREFESPYRSTVPLLSLVRDGERAWTEVLGECGLSPPVDLHFEYTVKPPKGEGRASHTDLMVIGAGRCMAVEAKWTEPPYESVRDWLGARGTETRNRKDVLAGWLGLIQPFAASTLTLEAVETIAYQTIHRAASACSDIGTPSLAYLQFVSGTYGGEEMHQKRLADLDLLHTAMGRPTTFPFRLIEIDIEPTAAFRAIGDLPKGQLGTSELVRHSLTSRPLFVFKSIRVNSVGRT